MKPEAEPVIEARKVAEISAAVVLAVAALDSGDETFEAESAAQSEYLGGWFTSIRRQAQAVLLLTQAELDYECAPLLRGMVEHAVLIRLLAQKPGFWRTGERARLGQVTKFQKWLRDRGYEPWNDLDRHAEGLDRPTTADNPSLDLLAAFRHQCEALGTPGDVWYARYQYLTHQSHGSVETAMSFVRRPGCTCDVCKGIVPLASPTGLALAALILLDPVSVLNGLLPSRPWTDVVQDMENACEPIRVSMGGAPFHIDRSELS